jgi:hypothetical protein
MNKKNQIKEIKEMIILREKLTLEISNIRYEVLTLEELIYKRELDFKSREDTFNKVKDYNHALRIHNHALKVDLKNFKAYSQALKEELRNLDFKIKIGFLDYSLIKPINKDKKPYNGLNPYELIS